MANTNLPVQELDFDLIKANLKEYLRGKPEFTDFDFEGSAITVLLDAMAYNTHYTGFYAHMLANEAFVDSANQKSSMTSKAKLLNYIPKSKKSSEATVTFDVDIDAGNEPDDRKIIISRGSAILSNNNAADSRTFVVTDDIIIYNSALNTGEYNYVSDETLIYEGTFEEERFIVDNSLTNQRYIIRNKDIDINTLRVNVYNTRGDTNFTSFKLADDFNNIDGDTPVFYLSVNEDDYYEVFFGNGVYGSAVEHANLISCSFVATGGELGNNAKLFAFGGDYTYNGNPYTIDITTVSNAEGGLESETVEDLRFNIPYHYRRQNRAVTIDDYRNILLSEYRNINSINVWGGEDNSPKTYGSVYISIKPLYGEVLSSKAKENVINNIIKKHNVATVDVEIVDPDYLYVNLDVAVRYNPVQTDVTTGQIVSKVNDAIDDYNTNVLNKFDGFYSDNDLNSRVKATDTSILTSYTDIVLEKRFTPALNSLETYYIEFINTILKTTVKSDEFEFRLKRSYFADDGKGNIVVWWFNDLTQAFEQYADEAFGTVDYDEGQIRLSGLSINDLYTTNGLLNVYAVPRYPDFFTKRNNIVVIDDYQVNVTLDYENESDKS
jgi:hypothetical protein